MTTFNRILKRCPRILILYPCYLNISNFLEDEYPFVKEVRENPDKYTRAYISKTESIGIRNPEYQIIELLTEWKGQHVEIMAVLFRKKPIYWYKTLSEFYGHILVELPDVDMGNQEIKIEKLKAFWDEN